MNAVRLRLLIVEVYFCIVIKFEYAKLETISLFIEQIANKNVQFYIFLSYSIDQIL